MGKTEHKSISSWELAKRNATPRTMITAYDYPFARLAAEAGIDGILVGDSLGMTVRGERDTLRVSLDEIIYHTEMVVRAAPECLIMADMPFGSFEESPSQAFAGAAKLLKAGADVVKIEGGAAMVETVELLSARAVPVCAHIGLTPQHIRQLGGFRKQGKTEEEASRLIAEAIAFVQAGARFVLMEAVPNELGAAITRQVSVPTIGIGAGADTDAQILVLHDVLGLTNGHVPNFARIYMDGNRLVREAIGRYVEDVRTKVFPQQK